jgi:hypothetical protein
MNQFALVYPMLALVLLTGLVLIILFRSRVRSVREGKVKASYFKIFQGGVEPEYAAKPARHFTNLLETPTLFYAACLAAMVTHSAGPIIQALAWVYVAVRVVHAVVHLGSNKLRPRIAAYFCGWLVLLTMWIVVAFSVATEG